MRDFTDEELCGLAKKVRYKLEGQFGKDRIHKFFHSDPEVGLRFVYNMFLILKEADHV